MKIGAEGLTLRLGGAEVLRDISATLGTGTITAICGPNGAGKSTLLSCLAGLLAASRGSVTLDGVPLAGLPARERARRIGYLPQSGEIAWDVSVRSLVALGRMPHGDLGEAQIAAALEAVDMTAFADRPVSTLSGGERARALLARVLAGEPRWVFADEPLAALDLAHQLALFAQLRETARGGAGVGIVLHDLPLAMNHADRVLVLNRGRLIADGPPAEALSIAVIESVWAVKARWIGDAGQRALVVDHQMRARSFGAT